MEALERAQEARVLPRRGRRIRSRVHPVTRIAGRISRFSRRLHASAPRSSIYSGYFSLRLSPWRTAQVTAVADAFEMFPRDSQHRRTGPKESVAAVSQALAAPEEGCRWQSGAGSSRHVWRNRTDPLPFIIKVP